MQLAELWPGAQFRVLRVVSGGEIGKRLVDLGFISGATGEVVRATLFRGPIQIRLGDYDLIMRRHEARLVDVELLGERNLSPPPGQWYRKHHHAHGRR